MSNNRFLPAGVEVRYNVTMPMRDGVSLSGDIYSPSGQPGPFPVILVRTPYDNMAVTLVDYAVLYAQNGYVCVTQDTRGRNDSLGEFYPWVNEFTDGYDSVEWIGAQPWCDGNVGMSLASYAGNVQWQTAVMGSRYLKTIVPRVIGHNLHDAPHYQGGAFQLGLNTTWAFRVDGRTWQLIDLYNWDQLFHTLPLRDIPKAGGKEIAHYQDWIDHPDYDDYWKALSIEERYEDIKIPVLQIGCWYDVFTIGTFKNYTGMRERGGSEAARAHQKAIVGPWVHKLSELTHSGLVDYGKASVLDLDEIERRWFDRWLKGKDNGAEADAPLRIFVMGVNEWRDEHEWPLARTSFTPYYFHSGGSANSLQGDGKLSFDAPAKESPDRYAYDPAFPTPTRGGGNCCNPEIVDWGAFDQRPVEYRSDVLVYTSDPLEEDLEITGPVEVKLFASTDARDTDFTAKLVDVGPDGYAVNVSDGIIRGRYRESREYQKLLEPGTVYEFTIEMGPTSNVFLKGHRIRVDIASSDFPRFDRNPNTGNKFGQDAELRVAHQTVLHDVEHASHIILPVVPRR